MLYHCPGSTRWSLLKKKECKTCVKKKKKTSNLNHALPVSLSEDSIVVLLESIVVDVSTTVDMDLTTVVLVLGFIVLKVVVEVVLGCFLVVPRFGPRFGNFVVANVVSTVDLVVVLVLSLLVVCVLITSFESLVTVVVVPVVGVVDA